MTVEHVEYEKLSGRAVAAETSQQIRERVLRARKAQEARFGTTKIQNAHMHARDIEKLTLSSEVLALLAESATAFKLSPRGYHRIIKLARTIADLDDAQDIRVEHVLEAFQYRSRG